MAPYAGATDALEFYATAQPMTAVPESQALDGLPEDPVGLASVVRGVLVHRDWAPLMGLQLPAERIADQHIRPVTEVIDCVLALWPAPLRETREPERRMVGVCRHFAVLHVALLRRIGIPARARAGFGGYFGPGWADHWITEWWDGRWVRHDAQISGEAQTALNLDFDPADQPAGKFLTGAEAWLACRSGDVDPQEFGIFDQRGLWFVFGDLMLDLAAINGIELLPWDGLGGGRRRPGVAARRCAAAGGRSPR
jgi:Transglutaminase-like superfamily